MSAMIISKVREREFCIGSTFRMRPSQTNAAFANVFHYGELKSPLGSHCNRDRHRSRR
jgi:hypothetical protein